MARSIKLIFLIILLCLPLQAFANIFDPPVTDLSVEYLGMIFGGNIGSINLGVGTLNNPFFGQLFQVFNGVILAVATFILTYIGTISIMHTAHEGEVMGKKWSSIWIPLRSAAGLLLMAPVPGSGYSLLQVTVMWIIINGIGAADKIWNLIVDNLAQGISPGQIQALDSAGVDNLKRLANSLGPNILNNLICLKVVEDNTDSNFLQQTGQILGANFVDDPNNSNSGNLFFGVMDANKPEDTKNQGICGTIKISANISTGELDPAVSSDQLITAKSMAYQIKKQALSSMINYIKPVANDIVTNIENLTKNNKPLALPNELQPGLLYPSVGIYASLLSGITRQNVLVQLGLATTASSYGIDGMVSDNINNVKAQGWITAGSFYFMLSKGSQQGILATAKETFSDTNPSATLKNTTLKSTSVNTLSQIFQTYSNFLTKPANNTVIKSLFNNPTPPPSSGSFQFLNPWNLTLYLIPGAGEILIALVTGVQGAVELFMNGLTNVDGDPLLEHARLGAALMGTCEALLLGLIVGFMAISIGFAWTGCMMPTEATVLQLVIMLGVPLMSIAAGLWVFGATLAIYTPMVPYMMFAITALSWIMLVIEAIVAAPIVALGLIMPAQEELGALHAALGIIANIFLRPMLMLIGLIMSVKIFSVMVKFIGFGFTKSIGILQGVELYGSLFSCIPIAGLYIGFVIALENKCFALIYQVPDKILRWIGISPETTDVTSVIQEAQKTHDAAASNTAQNLKETGSKQADNIQQQLKESSKNSGSSGGDSPKAPQDDSKNPSSITPIGDPTGLAGDHGGSGGLPGGGGGKMPPVPPP